MRCRRSRAGETLWAVFFAALAVAAVVAYWRVTVPVIAAAVAAVLVVRQVRVRH